MRLFSHPTRNFPNQSKLWASTSASRTTTVCSPPNHLQSLQGSSRSGFPTAMHSAATTSFPVTVSSRPLISRDLFETKDPTSVFSPTTRPRALLKVETSPLFSKTGRIFFLVFRMVRTSSPASKSFT